MKNTIATVFSMIILAGSFSMASSIKRGTTFLDDRGNLGHVWSIQGDQAQVQIANDLKTMSLADLSKLIATVAIRQNCITLENGKFCKGQKIGNGDISHIFADGRARVSALEGFWEQKYVGRTIDLRRY